MKKITTLLVLILTSASLFAQEAKPQTTIEVKVKVRKEQVAMGPYSRYAKQLLGVNAPLNNKTIYSIEGASIKAINKADLSKGENQVFDGNKIVNSPSQRVDFIDVSLNPITTGITTKSDLDLAKGAAETIFTLRKRRFDMVTGESNELGAGMGAAIKEMRRLEKEYLQLFIGKVKTDYVTYIFKVTPTTDRDKYIVCRISENGGLLSDTDISGEPVLLTLKSMKTLPEAIKPSKKGSTTVQVLSPELVECSLFVGTNKLMSETILIDQFGKVL
ncbi:MAG: DUF4831 family protein [Rikenellaceae bacterium]